MTKAEELIDNYINDKEISEQLLAEATAEINKAFAEMPKKLTFNTEGKINEAANQIDIERNKQRMVDLSKQIDAWINKNANS